MAVQRAYDSERPNGAGRRQLGDRSIYVFRLYEKKGAKNLGTVANGDSFLGTVRSGIQSLRNTIRQDFLGPLQGRILLQEFRFVLINDSFEDFREVRTAFRYAREGFYVDTPFQNALGVARFRISGHAHATPVLVNGVEVDGDSAIKTWRDMIEDYFAPRNGRPHDYELYWLNLNDAISAEDPFGHQEWLIHPDRNTMRTTLSNRQPMIRHFDFNFIGLRSNKDQAKAEDSFLAGMLSRGMLERLLGLVGLEDLVGYLDEVFGTLREVQGLIEDIQSVVIAAADYIRGVVQAMQASFAFVRGLLDRVQQVIGEIEQGIDMVKRLPSLAKEELTRLRQSFPGLSKKGSAVPGVLANDQLRKVRDVLHALLANPLAFSDAAGDGQKEANSVVLRIPPGTTLEQFAASVNVSPDTLIEFNNLRYPFVDGVERAEKKIERLQGEKEELAQAANMRLELLQSRFLAANAAGDTAQIAQIQRDFLELSTGYSQAQSHIDAEIATVSANSIQSEKALFAGELIRVPKERSGAVPSIVGLNDARIFNRILATTGRGATEEDRIFGIDFYLSPDGNLEWDVEKKDIRMAAGLVNVGEALRRYLLLPLGELRYAPGVGNFAFEDLASWQGPGQSHLLMYSIFKTLRQDARVREVRNVKVDSYAGVANVDFDVELINGEQIDQIRIPVE